MFIFLGQKTSWLTGQFGGKSLASVIIIHQVALGRAISQKNEANNERLRQMGNHDSDLRFQVTEAEPTSTIQPA